MIGRPDSGMLLLLILAISVLLGSALPLPEASPVLTSSSSNNKTTAVPLLNTTIESESNDTHQIYSVLLDPLHVGPAYELIEQSNSTNENMSQQSLETTGSKPIADLQDEKRPTHSAKEEQWRNITSELYAMSEEFAAAWLALSLCDDSYSACTRDAYNRMKTILYRIEDAIYHKLLCSETTRYYKRGYLSYLLSIYSDMERVVIHSSEAKILRAKASIAYWLLSNYGNRTYYMKLYKTFCMIPLEGKDGTFSLNISD